MIINCRCCKKEFNPINRWYKYCEDCRITDDLSYTQRSYRSNWPKRQITLKRHRAKKDNLEFNLEESDIQIPEYCPVLGIKLQVNHSVSNKDDSPSIDRIDPSKGYVKGNVAVISMKANRIKNDASLEEIEKVYRWLKAFRL